MEFAIRYGKTELPLTAAGIIVGRAAGCSITLDDALVSRQHAKLRVEGSVVVVEDLGSRNGVMVNGRRIAGSRAAAPGDRVVVGSVEFEVLVRPDRYGGTAGRAAIPDAFRTLDGSPAMMAFDLAGDEGESTVHTRQPEAFEILGSVVEAAIRAGHLDEAERLLLGHMTSLLADAAQGATIGKATKAAVGRLAIRVAEATKNGMWLDHLFQLHAYGPDVLAGELVGDLTRVIPVVERLDAGAVRDYVRKLKAISPSLGSADRLLLVKIQDLERAAVLSMTR